MTREQRRGLDALERIEKYVVPQPIFVAGSAKKLYRLEEKRNELMSDCAREWAKANGVPESEFWTRSLPQAMFDLLNSYQVEPVILACEAILKEMGWTIQRPSAKQEAA